METENMIRQVKQAMLLMTRQCWEQGIAAQALLETEDYESLSLMARDCVVRQSDDGRLCNVENTPAVTDSSFCIPAVYYIGIRQQEAAYREAAERNMEFLLHQADRSEDGVLFHMAGTGQIWADSSAFLPYSMALLGYHQEGISQMKGLIRKLRDLDTGLFYHIWDEESGSFSRKVFWGVGNGWFLTGLLRLALQLPKECVSEKEEIKALFCDQLRIMLAYKTENHLFYDVLDDETTYEESECAEMVAYSIFRGIKEGLLDEAYLETGMKIREAIISRVDRYGLVQMSAGSPTFMISGTAVEAQAHFLMMEQAFLKL